MKANEFLHKKDVAYMNRLSVSLDFNAIVSLMEEYAALRQPPVSGSLGFDEGYEKGWTDATSQAISEIQKNYKPNDR